MKLKTLLVITLLIYIQTLNAQEYGSKSISIGTNWGYFDRYFGRGPVLFAEYDVQIKPFLKISPHLLIANGKSELVYITDDRPFIDYSSTTTFEPGVVFKFIPFPKHFDRFKIIQGFSYLYENTLLSNNEGITDYWNVHYLDKGFNYSMGIDLDIIKTKKFRTGINCRLNTSTNRILLYHLGLVTNFNLEN